MDTKKVLVIAYACEPNKTSEPGVGWHFSHEIAKFMDVTVLTRANNKQGIEAKKNTFGIKYIYFDLPEFYTRIKKHIPLGIQIYSKFWQWKAYTEVKKIIDKNEEKFDVIHHLTFGTTKNVPPVYRFDVPFIWGPIGGGDLIPYRFLKKMDLRSHITEFFYILIHAISKISPWSYLSRKKAKAIIFRTSSSANNFPKNGCKNRYLISETALPKTVSGRFNKKISDVLNTVCIGRIMHGKGYIYALQGFHNFLIAGGNGRLVFLGKGPEEKSLRTYVEMNNLSKYVEFKGYVPNKDVQTEIENSHVLLHPSFREGGSWAIMEAMSFGLPVICLNTSGPKDMVTNSCGLLIDLVSPEQVSEDIGNGLLQLSKDSELYSELSKNAINRVKTEYNWTRRREQIKQVYDEVLNNK